MNTLLRRIRILVIIALAASFSLEGFGSPRRTFQIEGKLGTFSAHGVGQGAATSDTFPCNINNSRTQSNDDPRSKHTVALSWNASTSLLPSPAPGDGYNVYRLTPDNSCTKINARVPITAQLLLIQRSNSGTLIPMQ